MSASIPRSIIGSQPGMVDPSQRQRLLHFPTSTLSFASFNPRTASSNNDLPDLHKLSLHDQLNTAKRVVIETGPNGESFWRFVPKARRDEGVTDEGVWPRCVSLCGVRYFCRVVLFKLIMIHRSSYCSPKTSGISTNWIRFTNVASLPHQTLRRSQSQSLLLLLRPILPKSGRWLPQVHLVQTDLLKSLHPCMRHCSPHQMKRTRLRTWLSMIHPCSNIIERGLLVLLHALRKYERKSSLKNASLGGPKSFGGPTSSISLPSISMRRPRGAHHLLTTREIVRSIITHHERV